MIPDVLSDVDLAFAIGFIAQHHALTVHTPLADVVIGCNCTPGVQRNVTEWADHLLTAVVGTSSTTSDAGPPAASVDDRPAPVEEAGAGRVIPFPTK